MTTDELDSTRTPLTICWHCDRALDAATPIDDDAVPEPGAVSLCMYCGAVSYFEHDLRLRPPTHAELDELEQNDEFRRQYVRFAWARQRVMLQANLLRDRSDPDR
jgi:hypothetical protein